MGSQPAGTNPPPLNLLPWPQSVDGGSGSIRLGSARLVLEYDQVGSKRLTLAGDRLSEEVALRTGLALKPEPGSEPGTETSLRIRVRCEDPSPRYPGIVEEEGYWLVVDDAGVFIDAQAEWGVLRALTTLGQLIRPDGTIPHVAIDDRPRFCWRGLMLDPARHFLPVDALLRTLDGMAQCKLNVLHLHLSDDQGFRFPVREHPRLASADAYTLVELERVVEHAGDLGIRVIPEIDMPGHVTSWLVAYPEWGARQTGATDRFGVHPACLDPTSEAVYEAVEHIIDALVSVFPDPCIHIGGDEVSPRWWSEDGAVRELMTRESLDSVAEVQGYFNRRVGELVKKRGRRVTAWDEVLRRGDDPSWVVQAWRGSTARDRALGRGNAVVMSSPYYLDLNFPVDVHYGFDPAASGQNLIELEDGLLEDPRLAHVARGIAWTRQWREDEPVSERGGGTVLGGEACLWGELVTDEVLDVRLWTRLPALAERFWSAAELADTTDLHRRLDIYLDEFHPLRGRDLAAWTAGKMHQLAIESRWRPLTDMLEPVKWYGRLLGAEALEARIEGREMPQSRPYGVHSSLDRLIDHLPVESRVARELTALCRRTVEGDEQATEMLRARAQDWLELGEQSAEALAELQQPAERLARLGELIIERLAQDLKVAPELLDEIGSPMNEMMIALPPGLRNWLTNS